MSGYAAFLELRGRRCVVLGGGELAAEKVKGLLEAGGRVVVFARRPCAEMLGLARVIPRDYRFGDLRGAWLAIDASEDEDIHTAAYAEAARERVLLNVVDRPELCSFVAPALVRRGPLRIAISTSGESPFLASTVRAMIERLIGPEWGPFVALVGRARRQLRARGTAKHIQLHVYRRLLASNIRELLLDGDEERAEAMADRVLATPPPRAAA